MLEGAVVDGVIAAGGVALRAGVIPTPCVAVLVGRCGAALGCVISASHNPYQDNGIKFIGADGYKLSDERQAALERELGGDEGGSGRIEELGDSAERYAAWLLDAYGVTFRQGPRLVADCANGAAVTVAERVL